MLAAVKKIRSPTLSSKQLNKSEGARTSSHTVCTPALTIYTAHSDNSQAPARHVHLCLARAPWNLAGRRGVRNNASPLSELPPGA